MIVDVRYAYDAVVRRPRKRADDETVYAATTSVELVEVSGGEAPVALRYRETGRLKSGDEVEMRWFGDAFWRKSKTGLEETMAVFGSPAASGNPGKATSRQLGGRPPVEFERDDDVKLLVSSRSEEGAAKAAAAARDLLLVDGGLYVRSEEPRLRLEMSIDERFGWVRIEGGDPAHRPLDRTYRMDGLDALVAAAPEHVQVGPDVPVVEVVMPEAFRFPASENLLLAHARGLAEHMVKKAAKGTVEWYAAYVALRDLLADPRVPKEAVARLPEGLDLRPVAEALRVAVEAGRGLDGGEMCRFAWQEDAAAAALARYDAETEAAELALLGGAGEFGP